jgi:hypothetical protein
MALTVNNSIFIHLPKTGGTFLRNVLLKFSSDAVTDMSQGFHRHLDSHDLTKYDFTFSIVRHPITWYESVWKHINMVKTSGIGWGGKIHPLSNIEKYHHADFNTFIKNVLENEPGFYSNALKDYIGSNYDSVDFVAKTETLYEDSCYILDKLGISYDINILKATPTFARKQDVIWDSHNKELILQAEYNIIEKFYT